MDEACLSEAKSLSRLNGQHGAVSGRHPINTSLQHSSSNSIFGDASLPFMSGCKHTPLMSMDW